MEPRRLKAAAVASYFRSAIAGSSSKRASGDVEAAPDEAGCVVGDAAVTHAATCSTGITTLAWDGGAVEAASEALLDHPLAFGQVESAATVAVGDASALDGGGGGGGDSSSSDVAKANDESARSSDPLHQCEESRTGLERDASSKKYEVTYEYSPEDDRDDDDELCGAFGGEACLHDACDGDGSCHHASHSTSGISEKKLQLQYIDVLLQADSRGLGLTIQVAQRDPLAQCSRSASSLVVASFRRLHRRDVGPAEATRQIQRGDVLHSVDGEEIRDLQHLHSKLQRTDDGGNSSGNGDAPSVLLRFLRQVSSLNESDSASTSSLTTEEEEESVETKPSSNGSPRNRERRSKPGTTAHGKLGEAWLENAHQVAMVIRELATKNQELQEELVASKLKLAEQSIQLEQLYALYAKTQVEKSPVLAFPKSVRPFARRASASERNSISIAKRSGSSSKLHSDIEFVVHAERERLRKHYQLQMDIEKRQVAARHQRELQTLKEMVEKKLAMLDAGFQEALKQQQASRASESSIETCSCGTWMRLQQELYIHQSFGHDGDEDGSECLVWSLLTDARRTTAYYPNDTDNESSAPRRMQEVLEVLREYELLK